MTWNKGTALLNFHLRFLKNRACEFVPDTERVSPDQNDWNNREKYRNEIALLCQEIYLNSKHTDGYSFIKILSLTHSIVQTKQSKEMPLCKRKYHFEFSKLTVILWSMTLAIHIGPLSAKTVTTFDLENTPYVY